MGFGPPRGGRGCRHGVRARGSFRPDHECTVGDRWRWAVGAAPARPGSFPPMEGRAGAAMDQGLAAGLRARSSLREAVNIVVLVQMLYRARFVVTEL